MLVLLSGVSGAGKDTIKKELLKRMDNVITMPSYTDRSPRPGEENWAENQRKWVLWVFCTSWALLWNFKKNIKWKY